MGVPDDSDGNESACNAWDPDLMPGSERSPGEGNGYPLQYSCLENSKDREAWWSTVHRVTKSRTWPSDLPCSRYWTFYFLQLSVPCQCNSLTSLKKLEEYREISSSPATKHNSQKTVNEHPHTKCWKLQSKELEIRTSLVVQWIRVCLPTQEFMSSIPGLRIFYMLPSN